MAVKIRLSRIGKKHVPFYSIVAVDGRKKRDGAYLEELGTYDAINSSVVKLNQERVDYWLSVGAVPTDVVKKISKAYKKSATPQAPEAPKKAKTTKVKSEASQAQE